MPVINTNDNKIFKVEFIKKVTEFVLEKIIQRLRFPIVYLTMILRVLFKQKITIARTHIHFSG